MRTDRSQHGRRTPAALGGLVVVLATVLSVVAQPARAADVAESQQPSSAPVVRAGPSAAPEPALHRVTGAPAGGVVRLTHPVGLSVPLHLPIAARCDVRPGDLAGVVAPASGLPLHILHCTWLN